MTDLEDNPAARRSPMAITLTIGVVVVVAWFVSGAVREAWMQLVDSGLRLRWSYLAASGFVYLLALLPMAWFWRRVVAVVDRPVAWRPLLAAYYAGHLGKYVPGKAMVVVIRAALLKQHGGATGPLAVSVFVETLTMMAVGAVIAALLLCLEVTHEAGSPLLLAGAIGLAVLAAAPTAPPVLRRVLNRLAKSEAPPAELSWRLLAVGWAASFMTWFGLATSLWLVILGCGGAGSLDAATCRAVLLATTLPYVAGFLSLIPGGLFVRDALMLRLLAPTFGHGPALAVVAAARLVWIAAEIAVYGIMTAWRRRGDATRPEAAPPSPTADNDPPATPESP